MLSTTTILYLIIALVVSATLAIFYYNKTKKGKLGYVLGFLRFLVLFLIGVLLINPKLKHTSYTTTKPTLAVLVDNSSSIATIADTNAIKAQLNSLLNNKQLQEKFTIQPYSFSKELTTDDTLKFNGNVTDISKALRSVDNIYENTVAPVILLSDGNQTYGNDYTYNTETLEHPVYSVVVGDTTAYADVKISTINVNKYAFLKNDFPVEVFLNYQGTTEETVNFKITTGTTVVYQENITFSKNNLSKKITTTINAGKIGVQAFNATVSSLKNEKNTANNTKLFAIEVLDERTKVAIVSNFPHPDLGALKTSIESNEQREASILKPNEVEDKLNNYQLVILYQPDNSFSSVIKNIEKLEKNVFIITGSKTDWNFLNSNQNIIQKRATSTEEIQGVFNNNFSSFLINDVSFSDFPPLTGYLGNVSIQSGEYNVLLQQKIRNITLEAPLMLTVEQNNRRFAYLLGENSWTWRAKSYLENGDFTAYDQFIGKIIFYLASNKKKERLQVDAETFYYGNVVIDAAFFDKNYQFDANGILTLLLKNNDTGKEQQYSMQLQNSYFKFASDALSPGNYSFTVKEKNSGIQTSGKFTLIGYNVENQFYNADYKKMSKLSQLTGGEVTLLNNLNKTLENLINNQAYKPIQKSNETISPIISWKLLLFLIVGLLAAEWFLRKYNGLI